MSAPPVTCERCGHRIGKRREHYVLDDNTVWCLRCINRHDAYDRLTSTGTRAGIHRHRKVQP